jgi:hypothetical protein
LKVFLENDERRLRRGKKWLQTKDYRERRIAPILILTPIMQGTSDDKSSDDLVQGILDNALSPLFEELGDELPHHFFFNDDLHGVPVALI